MKAVATGAALAAALFANFSAVLAAAVSQAVFAQDEFPEISSGYAEKTAVHARRHMIVAAHPLAARAGLDTLRLGGNAVDAAIAAVLVLNLVEPQSSGIGGGALALYYDAREGRLSAFDGRETAPLAAGPDRFLRQDGRPMRYGEAVGSGRSVGVPGLVRMLEQLHREHGRLAWASLFEPAIRLAGDGFEISPRLAKLIAADRLLPRSAGARAYFFSAEGRPRAAGERLRNPELADVLRRIAIEGSSAFYLGDVARDIVAAVRANPIPGDMTLEDLARYVSKERAPICAQYRRRNVCGVPPPSSGGIAVGMILGLLARYPMRRLRPGSLDAVHLFAEAGRLAYADRDQYLADPDFVALPMARLLDPDYLAGRSAAISLARSLGTARPGAPFAHVPVGADATMAQPSTTHLSVVDGEGNVLALSSSVESAFGSRILVRGFLLNNQLTDFSWLPGDARGPAVNRVEGGKRPRSSMSPTIVFDQRDRPLLVIGSPGGEQIINYVAKTLVGVIDWRMDIQQAVSLPGFGSRNRGTELEKGTALEKLAPGLAARGHQVRFVDMTSGLHGIEITPRGLVGGADPRREGVALGD